VSLSSFLKLLDLGIPIEKQITQSLSLVCMSARLAWVGLTALRVVHLLHARVQALNVGLELRR
jgi:hypothetical protein